MRIDQVLVAPVITEKTNAQAGKTAFWVHRDANKEDVKNAVKEFYGLDIVKVNMVNLPSKTRIVGRGRTMTKRAEQRKAIVTLQKGESFDFNALA